MMTMMTDPATIIHTQKLIKSELKLELLRGLYEREKIYTRI